MSYVELSVNNCPSWMFSDLIKQPKEGNAADLSYQCSTGSKYKHETSHKHMGESEFFFQIQTNDYSMADCDFQDFQISLHQQTK